MELSQESKSRFARQLVITGFGEKGQKRLLHARVLVVGVGGLGSSCLYYLAACGVGTLGIVDSDIVDLTNLNRQILHTTGNIGSLKTASACQKLEDLFPQIVVGAHSVRFNENNGPALVRKYDFVVDCTDNFQSKFLINDVCVQEQKPFSHAGVAGLRGQTMTIVPGQSACYRCVFKSPPPPQAVRIPAQTGVLGAVAGLIGIVQATEAIKYILGMNELLLDCLLVYDARTVEFRKVPVYRNEQCRCVNKRS